MKNLKFSRLFAAMMFVAVLAFTGCKNQPDEEASIYGTWAASEYEKYVVTKTDFTSVGTYSGNELVVVEDSENSGRIFIKYTKAYEAAYSEPENSDSWEYYSSNDPDYGFFEMWYRYVTTAPDVGKWYAISYKDLKVDSVSISGAYKSAGKTSCETLDEAKAEFTVENGYFVNYSECKKQ